MYRWLRNTHLFTGLFSCLFLFMYGWSGMQLSHNRWFDVRPAVTESRVALEPGGAANPRGVARRLMEEHGLRGEVKQVHNTGDGCHIRMARPGTVYEIDYHDQSGQADIKAQAAGFWAMFNRLHFANGLWHDFGLNNVLGFFVGIVSAGLVLLGLTGVYLWFKIHTERVVGAILLAISLGYSLTLMAWMRAAAP